MCTKWTAPNEPVYTFLQWMWIFLTANVLWTFSYASACIESPHRDVLVTLYGRIDVLWRLSKYFFEYPYAKSHWRMEDPTLFAVMSVKRAMLPQTLRHHQAKNIYRNIYQDTTKHFNGGIFSMIFQWQGSVFKLVWRELLVYFMIYATISFIYRCVLVNLDDQRWGLIPHVWYI